MLDDDLSAYHAGDVTCPICAQPFPQSKIERHAAQCDGVPGVLSPASSSSSRPVHPEERMPTVKCDLCRKPMPLYNTTGVHYMNQCDHAFCESCLSQYIKGHVEQVRDAKSKPSAWQLHCPAEGCGAFIAPCDLNEMLSADDAALLSDNDLKSFLLSNEHGLPLVTCPSCGFVTENKGPGDEEDDGESGSTPTEQRKDSQRFVMDNGTLVGPEAAQHQETHRFRCRQCEESFCAACDTCPYHMGYTCDQYHQRKNGKPCRFCDNVIVASSSTKRRSLSSLIFGRVVPEVCNEAECQKRSEDVCGKVLQCGHACYGVKGEDKCPSCTVNDCPSNTTGQDCDEYCVICYSESLKAGAVVQLACGHVFHLACCKDKLLRKWPGARITFGFMNCPLCNEEISHRALSGILKDINKFRDSVRQKMKLRAAHEGLESSEAVINENSEYYNNVLGYAEAVLSYYQCYKCGKPYFGGFKQCEQMIEEDQLGNDRREELVCAACTPNADLRSCSVHGTDFIEFKCRFCCSIAQWFCWGTTHFCSSCHRRQEMGDYVTKKKREDLPQCDDKRKCPLRVDHPQNGVEFSLGCALCRHTRHGDAF